MLSIEERNKIVSDYMYGHLSDMCKAIERAVLAKIEEQKPVAEVRSKYGDPEAFGERHLHVCVDLKDFKYGAKLYAHPALPDGLITGILACILLQRREPMAPHNAQALREHLGDRSDEDLRFYVQNGKWPQ